MPHKPFRSLVDQTVFMIVARLMIVVFVVMLYFFLDILSGKSFDIVIELLLHFNYFFFGFFYFFLRMLELFDIPFAFFSQLLTILANFFIVFIDFSDVPLFPARVQ